MAEFKSKYKEKKRLQKSGNFSIRSPFTASDSTRGLSLTDFNNMHKDNRYPVPDEKWKETRLGFTVRRRV